MISRLFILISSFLLCQISFAQKNFSAEEPLAFTGELIYPAPGEEPIHIGVIVVANGKITGIGTAGSITIPSGTRVIDCKGGQWWPASISVYPNIFMKYDELARHNLIVSFNFCW